MGAHFHSLFRPQLLPSGRLGRLLPCQPVVWAYDTTIDDSSFDIYFFVYKNSRIYLEVRNIYGAESEQARFAKKTMEALFEGLCEIADKDHNKLISIHEWIDMLKRVNSDVKKNEPKWFTHYLTFLFKLFDVSADGVLDLAEYTDGMSTYGHSINDSHTAFKLFAVDAKGKPVAAIDLKQWHTYFHQLFFSTNAKDVGNNLFGTMD
ncbi:hypothetical protein L596_003134 [Steinernema carpocapsae]|uniref:EF-hand domain-containing protein n=1 Tax=Steinernema carpocapsae TaxID=34508 RepID=A0A4U8UR78_STECR|nr:hypothetical protein L596_003134 [Steinernema carpocapsae]